MRPLRTARLTPVQTSSPLHEWLSPQAVHKPACLWNRDSETAVGWKGSDRSNFFAALELAGARQNPVASLAQVSRIVL